MHSSCHHSLESRDRKSSLGGAGYLPWDLYLPINVRIIEAKHSFMGPCFMEILACATCNTWKLRNDNFCMCYMQYMEAEKLSYFQRSTPFYEQVESLISM